MSSSPTRLAGWLLGAAVLVVPFSALNAQWQTTGSDIYYDAGRVGIGGAPPSFSTVAVTGSDGVSLQVYNLGAAAAIRGQTVGGWAVTGLDFGTTPDSAGFYGIGVAGQTQKGIGVCANAIEPSGYNYGLWASTASPQGYAGWFAGRCHFTSRVGIGVQQPSALLHVKPAVAGEIELNVANALYVNGAVSGVESSSGTFVGVGRTAPINSSEVFGISAPTGLWGGMYIDTGSAGQPFYGYSTGGAARAYHYFHNADEQWRLSVGGTRIVVNELDGNVGVGTTIPSYRLHVNGSAGKPGGGSWSNASDRRLKKDVRGLDGALDKLLRLRGVTFEYRDPGAINELPGTQVGMIAQEVEDVFPAWVEDGPDGYKRLTFRGFEALTVEALRGFRAESAATVAELRAENADLKKQLREREERAAELEERFAKLESAVERLAAPAAR